MPLEDDPSPASIDLDQVPLFPLPNVVLFPRAILPLHIFEFRYREMTADVIAGNRLVAMALLRPGWEKDYHGRPPIEPVVCVGRLLNYEQLPDGKYNFLLQGARRATIQRELADRPYRYARLETLPETRVLEIDLSDHRTRLEALFGAGPLSELPIVQHLAKLARTAIPTAGLADVTAFHLIEQIDLKQSLLAEADVRVRVARIVRSVEALVPLTEMLSKSSRTTFN